MVEAAKKLALVLTGGGARGAYQAGVLKALAEQLGTSRPAASQRLPFDLITGVSAGAINASHLASTASEWRESASRLATMWTQLSTPQIYKTDPLTIGRLGFKLFSDFAMGGVFGRGRAKSFFDVSPIRKFLAAHIDFKKIGTHLKQGWLDAVSITAIDYASSESVSFVQAREPYQAWQRSYRHSEAAILTLEHIFASASIPLFFPAQKIGDRYFGDGSLRNAAPLSPAIRLGGDKMIIVGVRKGHAKDQVISKGEPAIARMLGTIMNAIFLDAVESDLERLSRINKTLTKIHTDHRSDVPLRPIETLYLRPSVNIRTIAQKYSQHLPGAMGHLIKGMGSASETSELISYLLFQPEYCTALVELGYRDTMQQRDQIVAFVQDR